MADQISPPASLSVTSCANSVNKIASEERSLQTGVTMQDAWGEVLMFRKQ